MHPRGERNARRRTKRRVATGRRTQSLFSQARSRSSCACGYGCGSDGKMVSTHLVSRRRIRWKIGTAGRRWAGRGRNMNRRWNGRVGRGVACGPRRVGPVVGRLIGRVWLLIGEVGRRHVGVIGEAARRSPWLRRVEGTARGVRRRRGPVVVVVAIGLAFLLVALRDISSCGGNR